jgi:hypothetical protein
MQAILLLEANQSTGSVRVALDLRINWASLFWIFRL